MSGVHLRNTARDSLCLTVIVIGPVPVPVDAVRPRGAVDTELPPLEG